jgi:hypothetical protein
VLTMMSELGSDLKLNIQGAPGSRGLAQRDDLGSRMEQGSSPASDCRSVLISQISINNEKLSVIRMILT